LQSAVRYFGGRQSPREHDVRRRERSICSSARVGRRSAGIHPETRGKGISLDQRGCRSPAGEATTDEHISNAIGWKVEALNLMGKLGDAEAADGADKFLDKMSQDSRPAVKRTVARLRFNRGLEKWQEQNEAQRLANLQKFTEAVRTNGLTIADARMLRDYSIMCGMMLFPTSDAAAGPYRDLLPLFRNNEDPKLVELTTQMEATVRRLELPGKKLELEGKLLDGSPLDWSSLKGKVVLRDSESCQALSRVPRQGVRDRRRQSGPRSGPGQGHRRQIGYRVAASFRE
jgi:hypothetical protein